MDCSASAISFLEKKVRISSVSFEEDRCADFIENYLKENGAKPKRLGNNIIVKSSHWIDGRRTLMLNSHIDTVKPSESYTFDPVNPPLSDDRVFGLGSNDAGGSLTSLIHTFLLFENGGLPAPCNLMLVLSCEEERSGKGGMAKVVGTFPHIADMAIIGEPTGMRAATAERGLLVIDATAKGVSGHAAREEGINAIYTAIDDINVIRNLTLPKISEKMGKVKMTVTQVNAGYVHNIVPDRCDFVVDIRPTDSYTNQEIVDYLQTVLKSELKPRNLTNRSSATPDGCPLLAALDRLGISTFISPTTSDWMRIGDIPAVKIGPGESSRSHKADEFIYKKEIERGIAAYIDLIRAL